LRPDEIKKLRPYNAIGSKSNIINVPPSRLLIEGNHNDERQGLHSYKLATPFQASPGLSQANAQIHAAKAFVKKLAL
jgi:hypothetical protein